MGVRSRCAILAYVVHGMHPFVVGACILSIEVALKYVLPYIEHPRHIIAGNPHAMRARILCCDKEISPASNHRAWHHHDHCT